MSGRHADVTFYSNVPNAAVVIRDKHGDQVAITQVQSKIALKRKDGWIHPAQYMATFTAPGYQPVDVSVNSKVNPWVFGNVVFGYGGIVGLAVDGATAAAWMPDEASYYQELSLLGSMIGPQFSATTPITPLAGLPPAPLNVPGAVAITAANAQTEVLPVALYGTTQ